MEIVGGAMSGYCSIGSDIKPIIPKSTKKMDITVDKTGRLMKRDCEQRAVPYYLCSKLSVTRPRPQAKLTRGS